MKVMETVKTKWHNAKATLKSRGAVVGHVVEQHQIGVTETGEIIVRKLQFAKIFHISLIKN